MHSDGEVKVHLKNSADAKRQCALAWVLLSRNQPILRKALTDNKIVQIFCMRSLQLNARDLSNCLNVVGIQYDGQTWVRQFSQRKELVRHRQATTSIGACDGIDIAQLEVQIRKLHAQSTPIIREVPKLQGA